MDSNNGDFEVIEKDSTSASSETSATSLLVSVPPPSVLPSFMIPSSEVSSSPAIYPTENKISNPASPSIGKSAPVTSCPVINQPSKVLVEPSEPKLPSISSDDTQKSEENHLIGKNWMGWLRGTVQSVGNKVAEKAMSSMDTVITTLDPQMKDFINTGGDIDIVVASAKDVKINPVKEAFQKTFGKATVSGLAANVDGVVPQPVGFDSAICLAGKRIDLLRSSNQLHPQQPIVAIESFIVSLHSDSWVEMSLLLLDDPYHDIILQTYTQPIPLPESFIRDLKEATPDDYSLKLSGFAKTVGEIAATHLQVSHKNWQESYIDISRKDLLLPAAKVLASLYKGKLPTDIIT